ncbi:SDR family oxidoreductase [Corynebacterium frankenforstense]
MTQATAVRPTATHSALVTGAASGIGRELALSLARDGVALMLSDVAPDGLERTVADARLAGAEILDATALDVTDRAAVEKWAQRVTAEHGVPDEVHHVAGIAIWGDTRTMPPEKWRKVIEVNLMGTVHVVQALVPRITAAPQRAHARRGRRGRRKLVLMSSAAGFIGLPWHAAYSASKGGVLAMAEVLRFDLRPHGVDVHVVAPGAVDTPLVRTIDIHGVDRANPRVARATALFQGHAVSPAKAAAKIRRGVARGRFLVTTSGDIAFGRWAQVNLPWGYKAVMRALNYGFRWASRGGSTGTPSTSSAVASPS